MWSTKLAVNIECEAQTSVEPTRLYLRFHVHQCYRTSWVRVPDSESGYLQVKQPASRFFLTVVVVGVVCFVLIEAIRFHGKRSGGKQGINVLYVAEGSLWSAAGMISHWVPVCAPTRYVRWRRGGRSLISAVILSSD